MCIHLGWGGTATHVNSSRQSAEHILARVRGVHTQAVLKRIVSGGDTSNRSKMEQYDRKLHQQVIATATKNHLADLANFTTSPAYAKTTVNPTVSSFFFNLTYREFEGLQHIPAEAFQDDENLLPHKFLMRVFLELKANDRSNWKAYWLCVGKVTPNEVHDYLMLRRHSRTVKDAAKALGWSEQEVRGQLRTDKEAAIANKVAKDAERKKLRGKAAQRHFAEANRKKKERETIDITAVKTALSPIWRYAGENREWAWTDVDKTRGTGNATLASEFKLLRQKTKKQDRAMGKEKKQAAIFEQEDLVQAQRKVCAHTHLRRLQDRVYTNVPFVYTRSHSRVCTSIWCIHRYPPCAHAHRCMHLHLCVVRAQIYHVWMGIIQMFFDAADVEQRFGYRYDALHDSLDDGGKEDVAQQRRQCVESVTSVAQQLVLSSVCLFDVITAINGFHRSEVCSPGAGGSRDTGGGCCGGGGGDGGVGGAPAAAVAVASAGGGGGDSGNGFSASLHVRVRMFCYPFVR